MSENKKTKKILFVALFRGIGDAVLFYPTIERSKKAFPNSQIDIILIRTGVAEVLKVYDFKGKIFIKPKSFLNMLVWLFKVGIKRYDIVFDASSIEQIHISRWLTWMFSKGDRVGYNYGSSSWLYNKKLDTSTIVDEHQKDIYVKLLDSFIKYTPVGLLAPKKFNDISSLPEYKGRRVVIHPGARDKIDEFTKSWPAKYYAKLIKQLADLEDTQVVVIGTEAEKKLLSEYKINNENVINLMGKLSTINLFAAIKYTDIFIGNNSGPLHIAVAYKIPVITFAGGISMKRWGLPNSNKNIVLGLDKRCRICTEYQCEYKGLPCLEAITVEETYNAVIEMIERL